MNYDLSNIAARVAHHMPGSWRLDRRPVNEDRRYLGVCILGDDHMVIRLQDAARMRKQGMIRISGECPDFGLSYQEQRYAGAAHCHAGINVSYTRPPHSIAADITRRLMPDYREALTKAKKAASKYKEQQETLNHVEAAFRRIMPSLSSYSDNCYNSSRRYCFNLPKDTYRRGELELSAYGDPHCDLKLSDLSVDTAMRILALLKSET